MAATKYHAAACSLPHQWDWGENWKGKAGKLMSWDKDVLIEKTKAVHASKARN